MSEPGEMTAPSEAAHPFSVDDAARSGALPGASPENTELQRLRSLLFQREIAYIDELRSSLANPKVQTENISSVLAEALAMRAGKDDRLGMALEPVVDAIVQESLRIRPQAFVNALFPLMGPSIRKSIAESFRNMMGNFSKSMEMAFSWKGLRWRLEAIRTGKPFSEVVLLHTLVYRVEEIFFIHSSTGIGIMHVVNEGVTSQDADMVSAMLTAIQDFVHDCLVSGREGELESLQHGDYTFMVEKQPLAYMACMVRGTPPADFRVQLCACLERLLVEYATPLAHFNGDTIPFASCRPHLEKLLTSHYLDEGRPLPLWTKAFLVLVAAGLLGGIGFLEYRGYMAEKQRLLAEEQALSFKRSMWDSVEFLYKEPGLMVIHVEPGETPPWKIICLKDSLSRSPEEVLREHAIDPVILDATIIPFVSYEPVIIQQRVHEAIRPPDGVTVRFDDNGVLHLSGTAPMEWILEVRQKAMTLPGVEHIDVRELSDPRMKQIDSMVRLVEDTVVEFPTGQDVPVPGDMPKLARAVDTLAGLEKLAERMGMSVSLTIYGHADATGSEKRNYEISLARARTIAAMLYTRGSSMPVSMYGLGADHASKEGGADQARRRIEMRIRLTRAAGTSVDSIP